MIVIKYFLSTRHCFKCFLYNDSLNPHSSPMGCTVIIVTLLKGKTERGQQLVSVRAFDS